MVLDDNMNCATKDRERKWAENKKTFNNAVMKPDKYTQTDSTGVQINSRVHRLQPDCWQCSAVRTSGLLMKSSTSSTLDTR